MKKWKMWFTCMLLYANMCLIIWRGPLKMIITCCCCMWDLKRYVTFKLVCGPLKKIMFFFSYENGLIVFGNLSTCCTLSRLWRLLKSTNVTQNLFIHMCVHERPWIHNEKLLNYCAWWLNVELYLVQNLWHLFIVQMISIVAYFVFC